VGRCPTPRELFVKSSIKNFKGMRVAHSAKWIVGIDDTGKSDISVLMIWGKAYTGFDDLVRSLLQL